MELPVSPLRLGHLRRDGTLAVAPLANPSLGRGGGGGRLVAGWPLGVAHNHTRVHRAVLA